MDATLAASCRACGSCVLAGERIVAELGILQTETVSPQIAVRIIQATTRWTGMRAPVLDAAFIPRVHGAIGIVESCKC